MSGTAFDVPAAPECAAGSCRDDGEPGRHEASVSRMRRAVLELGDAAAPVSSLWAESQRALRNSLLHDDVRGFRRWQSVAGMFESAPMAVRQHGDLTPRLLQPQMSATADHLRYNPVVRGAGRVREDALGDAGGCGGGGTKAPN